MMLYFNEYIQNRWFYHENSLTFALMVKWVVHSELTQVVARTFYESYGGSEIVHTPICVSTGLGRLCPAIMKRG